MKTHRHLVEALVEALIDVFEGGYYADKVVEYWLKKNKKWGSRDRRFFAEALYDIVRWWRLLWYQVGRQPVLDRENVYWVVGAWLVKKEMAIPDWEELRHFKLKSGDSADPRIAQSFPDWLYDLAQSEIGQDWSVFAKALNQPASVVLRTNTLKTSRENLIERLQEEKVECHALDESEVAVELEVRKNVFRTKSFKEGLFEVQDAASQEIAPLLNVHPGHRVVDACAGAGGKSLHLAALMQNKGRIVAMDIHEHKLQQTKKRAKRNGISILETRAIQSSKTIKRLVESADRVLLDVPCSGLGVIRRNPDSKWKLTPESIDKVNCLQKEILESYSRMLRPGGRLVYSTCSILPRENEGVVEAFLENQPGWKLLEKKNWSPLQYDGFFAAVLEKES